MLLSRRESTVEVCPHLGKRVNRQEVDIRTLKLVARRGPYHEYFDGVSFLRHHLVNERCNGVSSSHCSRSTGH
eukprot:5447663-Prymnesium_polylepis.1